MAIRHKRKDSAGYVWLPGDLVDGQIGLNVADGSLHFKKSDNTIISLGGYSSAINALLGASDAAAARAAIGAEKIPPGTVAYFASTSPPQGWLKRNGAAISRTAYADLFVAIGTTYGNGDGSTTFNLPDDRANFDRGWDDGRGIDSGRVFGSEQVDQLKQHGHPITGRRDSTSFGALNGFARPSNSGVNFTLGEIYSFGPVDGGAETRPRNRAYLPIIKY
ncbi:MAG: phage tail protein [Cyanobacteria bacterium P01_C01_bin.120]